MHFRMSSLGRLYDLGRTLVENRMVVCFHSDTDDFMRSRHSLDPFKKLLVTVRISGMILPEIHPTGPTSNAGGEKIEGIECIVNRKTEFSINRPAKSEPRVQDDEFLIHVFATTKRPMDATTRN
jgi:hypothetical protein